MLSLHLSIEYKIIIKGLLVMTGKMKIDYLYTARSTILVENVTTRSINEALFLKVTCDD